MLRYKTNVSKIDACPTFHKITQALHFYILYLTLIRPTGVKSDPNNDFLISCTT